MDDGNQWFGSRRRKLKAKGNDGWSTSRTVLLILHSEFFKKRDSKGKVQDEISLSVLQQVAVKFSKVLIFIPEIMIKEQVETLCEDNQLENIEVEIANSDTVARTDQIKKRIIAFGGRLKWVQNPREISYFNIDQFLLSDHITVARSEDHNKIGIEPEKPDDFDSLSDKRKGRSFW